MVFTPKFGSIVGRWDFNVPSVAAEDEAVVGNDATLNGATVAPGVVQFDGTNDFVLVPHHAAYALTSATILFRGTLNDLPPAGQQWGLFSKDSSGFGSGGHLTAWVLSDGSVNVRVQTDSGNTMLQAGSGAVQPGTEFTLVTTLDGAANTASKSVDGVVLDTQVTPSNSM